MVAVGCMMMVWFVVGFLILITVLVFVFIFIIVFYFGFVFLFYVTNLISVSDFS